MSELTQKTVSGARAIDAARSPSKIKFSICTLVSSIKLYESMLKSFREAGFTTDDCEFLYLDNTQGNQLDGYTGLNRLIQEARGDYIILCHQDIVLHDDKRIDLELTLGDLTKYDANWAIAGNSGGIAPSQIAMRITDPHGTDTHFGNLPELVQSLASNFMVLRADANLGLSKDLTGFHLCGTDLCLQAEFRGHTAYVIDFHLAHLSPGHHSDEFAACEENFRAKYNRVLQPRWIQTTNSLIGISGNQPSRTNRRGVKNYSETTRGSTRHAETESRG